ncbi:MAG: hypothetical protein GFH27_549305n41 [Chloroflexi bacterium AL-W]|nr:hypothetical protein [Chloroflexi bacterium AL-N1]NOK69287.1 hypothetical protein [Chloroflexi bacterium AL-N10]NOK76348.1 hypothetical protein [Chloroflexi bacterium AL-N5]NOK83465.1 hypothetical protein [Chloroflexi bacterium AL-W]NOK91125.1 hypothetical protein [Chloroflexi bacterium AL-N15]
MSRSSLQPAPTNAFVSLIIVTYNSAPLLPAFFATLTTTVYAPYEIIVVDNASDDNTCYYLAAEHSHVRLLANQHNVGFGSACNQGAKAARGDVLVFLNPDIRVTPDWLSLLVEHITEDPDTTILCPTTLYPDGTPQRTSTAVREVAAVPGCAMMMRTSAWQKLGGFDEHMFLYWEDIELCWRCWLSGGRVLADLQAIVYHERGGSAGDQRWDAERTKNSLYTYLKLMRWQRVIPFATQLMVKTLVKLFIGRGEGLLGAWRWNMVHLTHTLASRQQILGQDTCSSDHLERMIDIHNAEQQYYRQHKKKERITTHS